MRIFRFSLACLCLFFCFGFHLCAQNDFEKIEKACLLAQSGLSDKGSPSELLQASKILKTTKWSALNLQHVDKKAEVSVNGRMVFVPEFMDSLYVNRLVYKTAADYLKRAEKNRQRGGDGEVRLTTKALAAKGAVVYGIRISGDLSINVSAVSEPYGLINLKVRVVESLKKPGKIYSDHYRETTGYSYRKLKGITSEGNKILLIEVSNHADVPVNYALIMNTQKQ